MRIHLAIVSLLTALSLNAAPLLAQGNPDWHREIPGFKIAGNLYYVGTADLAVYLVNTPQGNILINSDFRRMCRRSRRPLHNSASSTPTPGSS